MNNKKQISIAFLVLLLVGFGGFYLFDKPNAPAAEFSTIAGGKLPLAQLAGKPVLVTFWATNCPSCIKEIPDLIDLHERYHAEGLNIIAVAMYYDIPSRVVAMARDKQLPYHVALDIYAQHAKQFGDVRLTPASFLISPDQEIVWSGLGRFEVEAMNKRIESLLQG